MTIEGHPKSGILRTCDLKGNPYDSWDVRVGVGVVPIWVLVFYANSNSTKDLIQLYGDRISEDDVRAAMAYYQEHKKEIDNKIATARD